MKRVAFISIFILFLTNTTQPISVGYSNFDLRLWDSSFFTVIFDGVIYDTPTQRFQLKKVLPGKHTIIIFKFYRSKTHYSKKIFQGTVQFSQATNVHAVIDHKNSLSISRVTPLFGPCSPPQPIKKVMMPVDFKNLKQRITKTEFESSRIEMAKKAVNKNNITARQVFEIMLLFEYESTRLDFAKYAYRYTVNKHLFYIVNDAFTFSSSIRKLRQYINNYQLRA
jgi:hypothetical protein